MEFYEKNSYSVFKTIQKNYPHKSKIKLIRNKHILFVSTKFNMWTTNNFFYVEEELKKIFKKSEHSFIKNIFSRNPKKKRLLSNLKEDGDYFKIYECPDCIRRGLSTKNKECPSCQGSRKIIYDKCVSVDNKIFSKYPLVYLADYLNSKFSYPYKVYHEPTKKNVHIIFFENQEDNISGFLVGINKNNINKNTYGGDYIYEGTEVLKKDFIFCGSNQKNSNINPFIEI